MAQISRRVGWKSVLTAMAAAALGMGVAQADERLMMNARVNDYPARLGFDTGAPDLVLFSKGIGRLGVRLLKPVTNTVGDTSVVMVKTAITQFELDRNITWSSFLVVDLPSYLDPGIDGVVGWPPVKHSVIQIDAANLKVDALTNVPDETSSWMQFRLLPGAKILTLELPGTGSNAATVVVDTGDDRGASLSPRRWKEWETAYPNGPATLWAGYMPGAGLGVEEQRLAKELVFGPLKLTEVPVTEFNGAQAAMGGERCEAFLGIAALKQLDFIVDGRKGFAYVRVREGPRAAYQHNRLGAVFVPAEGTGDALVGHVTAGSPAYESGIRPGDELLKIGDLDATKWRTDPGVLPLTRFWTRAAGTKLELTVKRRSETLKFMPVLRDILVPVK